ncbi:MAG: hypothetical protein HW416_535 [Chloroflexi bacterium]|nr:hypothetical protein [Chloroflexota bacterium]
MRGWTAADLFLLAGLGSAEVARRLAILPTELVEAAADLRALQPAAGRFEISEDAAWFAPRFPFVEGRSYSLIVDLDPGKMNAGSNVDVWRIERPPLSGAPTTKVLGIYPSAVELPLNQLKLYIHFSSPMSDGWATRAIHVRRAEDGEPIEDVLLPMEPELWDPDRRRLTVLLDPGRIKRGLAPHEEAGYPLTEGVPVIVSVDCAFRDAAGRPLSGPGERRYVIGPAVRARVDPAKWTFGWPAAKSTESLVVEFDRPLDHALLQHSLRVEDAVGALVPGRASVALEERGWRFEPLSPWGAGPYRLIADPRLEDLAGNSLARVFDRDLTREEDTPTDAQPFGIDFSPRGRSLD